MVIELFFCYFLWIIKEVFFCSIVFSKEKRSVANGISPGMEEQSEYFDATENPLFKDKRPEQDDEDSGVDNASQILRESSVSKTICLLFLMFYKENNLDNIHITQNLIMKRSKYHQVCSF